ncbi:MAG TPA: hypothetical protein VF997_20500, partial [Polyangia bacterium]
FGGFNRMIERIDDAAHAAVDGRTLGTLAALLATVALVLFARSWPARGHIDGQWTRAATVESGWRAWRPETTAAYLRDEVALRLSDALGAPIVDWTPAELERRLARTHGPRAAASAARLWSRLRRPSPWIGARAVERLHARARELFDLLAERGQG